MITLKHLTFVTFLCTLIIFLLVREAPYHTIEENINFILTLPIMVIVWIVSIKMIFDYFKYVRFIRHSLKHEVIKKYNTGCYLFIYNSNKYCFRFEKGRKIIIKKDKGYEDEYLITLDKKTYKEVLLKISLL